MAQRSVNWSAPLSSVAGSVAIGQCLVPTPAGYVVGTTANRATYGRCDGIAETAGDASNPAVRLILDGVISAATSGLPPGSASWVRVSATGTLERCTPASGDDIVGKCKADGSVNLLFGQWDSNNYSGGGAVYVPPTGDGYPHITAGAQDAAAGPINLAGGATHVTGILPTANQAAQSMGGDVGGTTAAATITGLALTKLAAGTNGHYMQMVAGAWASAAPSIALATQVTGVLPAANQAAQTMGGDVGGTTAASTISNLALSKLAPGTNGHYVQTVGGVVVSAAPSIAIGSQVTGLGANVATLLATFSGANMASALSTALPNTKGGTGQDASAFTGVGKWAAGVHSAATLVNADVSAAAAIDVSKLAAGTNTHVLTTVAGVPTWAAPAGGAGAVPTGTGFYHVTAGVMDAASVGETGSGNVVRATSATIATPILTTPRVQTRLDIDNTGGTFQYQITPAALAANRILNLPLLTATDTFAVLAFAQTFTNKTMVAASNTITDTSAATGDLFRHNGTRFVRLARGTANQVLATNSGATDIAYTSTLTNINTDGGRTEADSFRLKGRTDYAGTGLQQNISIGSTRILRCTGAALQIGGIAGTGVEDGEFLLVIAIGGTILLNDEDVGSTATNRLSLPGGGGQNIYQKCACLFFYDAADGFWRVASGQPLF